MRVSLLLASALIAVGTDILFADEQGSGPGLGEPLSAARMETLDRLVMPDGEGLPIGSGTVQAGKRLYTEKCQACHGEGGVGDSADALAGAEMSLRVEWPEKTIGNYWPYATTLFDFIRRAKPMDAPGSLEDDAVYSLSAYLLYLNGLVTEDAILDQDSLLRVKMPNRAGFEHSPY